MANPHTAPIITMPAEIHDMICGYLGRRDLQAVRLVCENLRDAAEPLLFRIIMLRRTRDSYEKLQLIATHARLGRYVKAVCHHGRILGCSRKYLDFEKWKKNAFGMREDDPKGSGMNTGHKREILTEKALRLHQQFCPHLHSELLVDLRDLENDYLISAFENLPNLMEIGFHRKEPNVYYTDGARDDIHAAEVESGSVQGRSFHSDQFTRLLTAAHATGKNLKVIEGMNLPYTVFRQPPEVLVKMQEITTSCHHLAIAMAWKRVDSIHGTEKMRSTTAIETTLANMILNASSLRSLQLSFDPLKPWHVKLSHLLQRQPHWPKLNRLKLEGLSASQVDLKKLLSAHSCSLRFLELCNITLEKVGFHGTNCHGSWISIILFLHATLDLETVALGGKLTSTGDEGWTVQNTNERGFQQQTKRRRKRRSCLKHRIQRFVVDGGMFPLPKPTDPDWNDMLAHPELFEDRSWQLLPGHPRQN